MPSSRSGHCGRRSPGADGPADRVHLSLPRKDIKNRQSNQDSDTHGMTRIYGLGLIRMHGHCVSVPLFRLSLIDDPGQALCARFYGGRGHGGGRGGVHCCGGGYTWTFPVGRKGVWSDLSVRDVRSRERAGSGPGAGVEADLRLGSRSRGPLAYKVLSKLRRDRQTGRQRHRSRLTSENTDVRCERGRER